ncbi:MAG: hypothetical protein C4K58_03060 [Flavobacteriaceae bacterium]|nr:MAG: hypothetical protein C4K58_03060 [Flavobacteriaceae bacterium]
MKIQKITSAFTTNTYYVESGSESILVDASHKGIVEFVQIPPKNLLLTHGHVDHIEELEFLRSKFGIEVILQKQGQEMLTNPMMNGSALFGGMPPLVCKPAEIVFESEEFTYQFGESTLHFLHTPGHSPDSSIFYSKEEKVLFCGDLIFENSIGRSDFPHSNTKIHLENVEKVLKEFPDDTMVYPGHGEPFLLGKAKRDISMVVEYVKQMG